MRGFSLFVLAFCFLLGAGNARVKRSDAEMEEIREKLDSLHDVLEELNGNIAQYNEVHGVVEAQGEQMEMEVPAQKRSQLPESAPVGETDQALKDFEEELSDEDLALLKSMKSKVKYLQRALHEDNAPNPGDDQVYEEEQPTAQRRQYSDDEAYMNQLSPEDQQLIQKYPSIMAHLKQAMAEGSVPLDQEEPLKRDLDEADAFIAGLSPEDQELLQKHHSMLSKVQAAARKPTHTDQDEVQADEPTKRDQSEADAFIAGLSPEDQELLQKHHSMLSKIQAAVQKPTHTQEEEMLADSEQGQFQDFVVEPEEAPEELQVMKQKLTQLRNSLDEYNPQPKQGKRCLEGRDCDEPSKGENTGRQCRCGEPDCRCENDKRAMECPCEDRECRCEENKGSPPERQCRCENGGEERECRCEDTKPALTDVEERFLQDVQYAKARGVTLRQLIEALAAKKREPAKR